MILIPQCHWLNHHLESAIIKKVLSPFSSISSGAYSIFIGSNHGTAKGDNAVEKMKSLSKEWKALSAEEKADYTALAKKETAVKLKRFESLPETGKLLLALVKLQKQAKKKAKTNEGKVDEKTGKPLSTSFKRILARSVSDEMREMRELLPSLKAPTARALLVKKGIIEFGGKPSTSDVEASSIIYVWWNSP